MGSPYSRQSTTSCRPVPSEAAPPRNRRRRRESTLRPERREPRRGSPRGPASSVTIRALKLNQRPFGEKCPCPSLLSESAMTTLSVSEDEGETPAGLPIWQHRYRAARNTIRG